MEPVPPPHERSWRHPSELAPPAVEETPRRVRIAAAVTGAASVALVGLFALTVTPSNSAVVVSSSTLTPSASMVSASERATTLDEQVPGSEASGDEAEPAPAEEPVVVFVDSGTTITTSAETDARGYPRATVRFSTRLSTRGVLLEVVGGVAVVEIDPDRPRDRELVQKLELPEYVVASSVPDRTAMVTAMSGTPEEVQLDEIDDLELEPGTAVVDKKNHLIAICDEHGDVEVLAPDPDPLPSTTEEPEPTGSPATSEAPDTTTTTTAPETTATTPDTGTSVPTTTVPPTSSTPDATEPTTSTTTDDSTSTAEDDTSSTTTTTTTGRTTTPSSESSEATTTTASADSTNGGAD